MKKKTETVPLDQSTYIPTTQQIQINKYVLSNSLSSRICNSTTGAKINQQVTVIEELPSSTGAWQRDRKLPLFRYEYKQDSYIRQASLK